jgi:hypothetical protein
MPFGFFFGRFHFYCSMLARRAKIAVRCISIMLACSKQIDGKNNKKRFLARFPKNWLCRPSVRHSVTLSVGAVTRERRMVESSKLRQIIALML